MFAPRWRRWLVAGLAMFGVSYFLPVIDAGFPFGPISGLGALLMVLDNPGSSFEVLSALSNGWVLGTLLMLRRTRPTRWLTGLVAGATFLNLYWVIDAVLHGVNPLAEFLVGYWAWVASFGCMAAALWLRNRDWKSARVKEVVS